MPPPNAFQLYRGLQDVGVPSKLIIYKGFEGVGHGPSKPKSSRAVMQHNLEWFDKYIWGVPAATTALRGNNSSPGLVGSLAEVCERLERERELYGTSYIFGVGAGSIDALAPVVAKLAGK